MQQYKIKMLLVKDKFNFDMYMVKLASTFYLFIKGVMWHNFFNNT